MIKWKNLLERDKSEVTAEDLSEIRIAIASMKALVSELKNKAKTGSADIGTVIMWDSPTLPTSGRWAVCNGSNGTNNMQDRFIMMHSEDIPGGTIGGTETEILESKHNPPHTHLSGLWHRTNVGARSYKGRTRPYASPASTSDATTSWEGGSEPHNNIPPYYAVVYLKRII